MEEKEAKKKNDFFKKYAYKIIVCLIIIILIICVITLGIKLSESYKTQEKTTKLGLADVGELVTQTCYTTVLEDSKVNREFFKLFDIPFTESRQIFSYDFEVDASINFDEIDIKKIDDENKIINIKMPHAKVYKTTLNPASFKVYLDSESLFSRIDLEKHNNAVKKMQEQAEKDCVANKLLESADNNAQKLLSGIVKGNTNYKDYTVSFEYKDGK